VIEIIHWGINFGHTMVLTHVLTEKYTRNTSRGGGVGGKNGRCLVLTIFSSSCVARESGTLKPLKSSGLFGTVKLLIYIFIYLILAFQLESCKWVKFRTDIIGTECYVGNCME